MRLSLTPGQPFDIRELQENSTLDNAQAVALVNSLTAQHRTHPGTARNWKKIHWGGSDQSSISQHS